MVPSSAGSDPVRLLSFRYLHTHAAAALSPQPDDGALVQAQWVREGHAHHGQRVHGAQLCGQRPREAVGVQIPAPRRRAQPTTR
jgi:hypothetical protein